MNPWRHGILFALLTLTLLALAPAGRVGLARAQEGGTPPAGDGGESAPPAGTETPPEITKALSILAVPASVSGDTATCSYSFSRKSDRECLDWVWPQRAERATLSEPSEGCEGYSVAQGNRGWGKGHHKVEVGPPCSIDFTILCDHNGAESAFLVTLCESAPGKGIAIDWGKKLARVGGRPPKGGPVAPARADVRAGREYSIQIAVADGQVSSTINGVEAFRAPVGEKDCLPGKVGFEIHDAKVIFKTITITGKVSRAWAEKAAKAGGGKKPGK